MFKNDTFYPTPSNLAIRMICKIKGEPVNILEPSAGKGDIIEALNDKYKYVYHKYDISTIEIDETLQATLRGKGFKVIDTDFLTYSGPDKFDLIIANPPFNEGDKHLLKAIDILYRGQIIFLLNAETLKNPCTRTRQELVKKLNDMGAEIEYIKDAFLYAERSTSVEIALVNIIVDRKIEDDLFSGCDDRVFHEAPKYEEKGELSTGKTISELVAEYNQTIQIGTETIIGFYRNYKKIGHYLRLNEEPKEFSYPGDMTTKMQDQLNKLLSAVRTDFWRRTLDLREVRERLTSKKQEEFEHQLKERCYMDFTENNIRQFILNIIAGYEKTLTEAVMDIFDKFTIRHSWSEDNKYEENIHYYNGWKTNKAFKVNKRVVIPIYGRYGSPFNDSWNGAWKLNYGVKGQLDDIDKVMNYFDGMPYYEPMSAAIENAFQRGQSSKIKSTYFTLTCYKKGTIHLTFNSEDILRRFNVVAAKGKNWLPCDYGVKPYAELTGEEREVVDSFEGEESYINNHNKQLFAGMPKMLELAA